MAAELHALSYGFDNSYVVKVMVEEMFGNSIPIHGLIDSKTLFNVITKGGQTVEKRLQIDAFALRQSHHKGELQSLAWVLATQNVADALTKELPSPDHCLFPLMKNNVLQVTPQGWVQERFASNAHESEPNRLQTAECQLSQPHPESAVVDSLQLGVPLEKDDPRQ